MKMVTTSLTELDLKHISTQINVELNIPWVPEAMEQAWIEWAIAKILAVVPGPVVKFLSDASDGLSDEEIAKYEVTITEAANALIDIPYAPEVIEAALIKPIVHQLLQFATSGKFLEFKVPA